MTLDFSRCRDVWVLDADGVGRWERPPAHVVEGVWWIVDNPYGQLADDMGGMKTAQTIIAAQFMHDLGLIDRVIVVAPANVRSTVWFNEEIGQLAEQVFVDKLNIVSEWHSRVRQWQRGPDGSNPLRWIVTNFEYIRNEDNLTPLLQYCGPKTFLVVDESSAVRGRTSAQTDAVMTLRWKTNKKGNPILGVPRCGRCLELNGTPLSESPMDAFTQMNLLHPSILDCRYVTHFRGRYAIMGAVRGKNGKAIPNPRTGKPLEVVEGWTNLDDLQRRCAPYVLRREKTQFGKDWAEAPVPIEVTLTPTTWNHYKDMRDEMVAWLESGVATARTAAIKSLRLSQITSGFLGGVEQEPEEEEMLWDFDAGSVGTPGGGTGIGVIDATVVSRSSPPPPLNSIQEIGREKLDASLGLQEELLKRDPDLKLLSWCRFVPELRRYLREVEARFAGDVGAACGQKVFDWREGSSQKRERDQAMRLLHPKTAPPGPVTVGATQGTGALGLNFTACHTVLDVSYDFSAMKKQQGDSRVNRTGQTRPVSFYYLIAVGPKGQKTIDHHVMATRTGKIAVNDWTVAGWVKRLKEE